MYFVPLSFIAASPACQVAIAGPADYLRNFDDLIAAVGNDTSLRVNRKRFAVSDVVSGALAVYRVDIGERGLKADRETDGVVSFCLGNGRSF